METLFGITVDKESLLPKHYQIQQGFLTAIRKGLLKFGDMLPPEGEIAEELGVSRMTIRRALEDLVRVGYLERSPGVGSVIKRPPNPRKFWTAISFTEEIRSRGFVPGAEVLRAEAIAPSEEVRKALNLEAEETVYLIDRIRYANDEVTAFNRSHIPVRLCPDLNQESLASDGLYHIIQDRYGYEVTSSTRTYEKGLANTEEATLLHIKVGDPVLRVTGVTYIGDKVPMDYCKETYRE